MRAIISTEVAGNCETFSLQNLSDYNYPRHRKWRLVVALVGIAVAAGLAVLLLEVVEFGLATPCDLGAASFIAACGFGFELLILGLACFPIRFWARPPIELQVAPDGLVFALADGARLSLRWNDRNPRIDIVVRANDPAVPTQAQYRIMATHDLGDRRLPWRKAIPLTYVPPEAIVAILNSARSAGLTIKEEENFHAISSFASKPGTFYQVQGGRGWSR